MTLKTFAMTYCQYTATNLKIDERELGEYTLINPLTSTTDQQMQKLLNLPRALQMINLWNLDF